MIKEEADLLIAGLPFLIIFERSSLNIVYYLYSVHSLSLWNL